MPGQVLESRGVDQGKILFLTLIAAPEGIHHMCSRFPRLKLITTEIDECVCPDTFHVMPGAAACPSSQIGPYFCGVSEHSIERSIDQSKNPSTALRLGVSKEIMHFCPPSLSILSQPCLRWQDPEGIECNQSSTSLASACPCPE